MNALAMFAAYSFFEIPAEVDLRETYFVMCVYVLFRM